MSGASNEDFVLGGWGLNALLSLGAPNPQLGLLGGSHRN